MATTTDTSTSASATVDAPPDEVFAFLRDPANHAVISGDGSVRGTFGAGGRQLGPGDRFGMRMRIGIPYLMQSQVREFEQDRRIAWAHLGGHRWRWELEPLDDGRTRVTETFDMATSRIPAVLRLAGFPRRHERNVERSVGNLADHFADRASRSA